MKKVQIIIAGVIAMCLMLFVVVAFNRSDEQMIVDVAQKIAKSCPFYVDDITLLNHCEALPNKTLRYSYTLVNIYRDNIDIQLIDDFLYPKILVDVQQDEELAQLKKIGTTFIFYYLDHEGEFVTQYVISPEMY